MLPMHAAHTVDVDMGVLQYHAGQQQLLQQQQSQQSQQQQQQEEEGSMRQGKQAVCVCFGGHHRSVLVVGMGDGRVVLVGVDT